MAQDISSIEEIMAVLPAVQAAVRKDVGQRIAAGEAIARVEDDRIVSQTPPSRELKARRAELMKRHAAEVAARERASRKSVA